MPKKGERYLFAPRVVPVLGRPRAVGLSCGALPHWLRPVCAPLPLGLAGVSPARGTPRLGAICTGSLGLHSSWADLLLPGAEVELALCHREGKEGRQCEDDQPHDDGLATAAAPHVLCVD